jgi:hypothetical protein
MHKNQAWRDVFMGAGASHDTEGKRYEILCVVGDIQRDVLSNN